jgi:hypothetical protein
MLRTHCSLQCVPVALHMRSTAAVTPETSTWSIQATRLPQPYAAQHSSCHSRDMDTGLELPQPQAAQRSSILPSAFLRSCPLLIMTLTARPTCTPR